jgi:hypothetical protein
MGIAQRFIGALVSVALLAFGWFSVKVGWKEVIQLGPQMSGLVMIMGAVVFVIAVIWLVGCLTPQRWWPQLLDTKPTQD